MCVVALCLFSDFSPEASKIWCNVQGIPSCPSLLLPAGALQVPKSLRQCGVKSWWLRLILRYVQGRRDCADRFRGQNYTARIAWEMCWETADSCAWCGWGIEHSSIICLKPSLLCSLWRRQHATNPKSPSGSCRAHKILLPFPFLYFS